MTLSLDIYALRLFTYADDIAFDQEHYATMSERAHGASGNDAIYDFITAMPRRALCCRAIISSIRVTSSSKIYYCYDYSFYVAADF